MPIVPVAGMSRTHGTQQQQQGGPGGGGGSDIDLETIADGDGPFAMPRSIRGQLATDPRLRQQLRRLLVDYAEYLQVGGEERRQGEGRRRGGEGRRKGGEGRGDEGGK